MVVCPQCSRATSTILDLKRHYLINHNLKVDISTCSFSCKEPQCYRSFPHWYGYKHHLIKVHKVPLRNCETSARALNSTPVPPSDGELPLDAAVLPIPVEPPTETPPVLEVNPENVGDSSARVASAIHDQASAFCERLYSNKSFCRSDVNSICREVNDFVATTSMVVKEAVVNELTAMQVPETAISKITGLFFPLQNSFHDLSSDYLRRQHLQRTGRLIEPEEFTIGCSERTGPDRYLPAVPDKGARVPLKILLSAFFSKPRVLETVLRYMKDVLKVGQRHSVVKNFVQGEFWTNKLETIFRDREIVLPLSIFSDAFQVNNGFGPHAASGKLEGVYMSILVLPPELKSRLDHIFCIALIRSADLKAHGSTAVFQHLVDELIDLEENGIEIETAQGSKKVYFALGVLMGDNLGMQEMLNFVKCFIANVCCRVCRVPKQLRDNLATEDPASLRNAENYRDDVLLNDSSRTGVIEVSDWNRIPSFHITENFAADSMHDLYGGVCHYDCAHILRGFIFDDEPLFTLGTLNARLKTFAFTFGKNQPQEISASDLMKAKFLMTASEMSVFVRSLGAMIGDLVPQNDERWEVYLSLRHIIDLVAAPIVTEVNIRELKDHVEEHNAAYVRVFEDNLKFKHHMLTHYPRIMSKIGPLSQTNCMRMEAKHRDCTIPANATSSRRNPPFTLLLRHQLALAESFGKDFYGVKSLLETGTSDLVRIRDCDDVDLFSSSLPKNLPEILRSVSWVDYKGTKYEPGTCVVIGNDPQGVFPQFGVIKHVFLDDKEQVYIVSKVYFTEFFDDHRYAYAVSADESMTFQSIDSLFDSHPVSLTYVTNGSSYVIHHHKL